MSVATRCAGSSSPVFSTTSATAWGIECVRTATAPPDGRLCTIALSTRFVTSCGSSVEEPSTGAGAPPTSTATPRRSASGTSASTAPSARSDRSTISRVNARRSARLSSSSASVSSIARALTSCRRAISASTSRCGAGCCGMEDDAGARSHRPHRADGGRDRDLPGRACAADALPARGTVRPLAGDRPPGAATAPTKGADEGRR